MILGGQWWLNKVTGNDGLGSSEGVLKSHTPSTRSGVHIGDRKNLASAMA